MENNKRTAAGHTAKVGLKKACRTCAALVLVMTVIACAAPSALAADDPLNVITNLSDFIFAIIRAIGLIVAGFGILQFGMSFQSHDPSQRTNGVLAFTGGVIVMFSKSIIDLITG